MTRLAPDALEVLFGTTSGEGRRRFIALPSNTEPRLLVPTRPRAASAAILRALRDTTSLRARAKTQAARASIAIGVGSFELPDPGVLDQVVSHLPDGEYTYGVHLGPARANRKPVIAIVTADGVLTAFAKCGVDHLTDRLVRRESEALSALVGLTSVTVPKALGSGDHNGHPYLVESPVPTKRSAGTSGPAVITAQIEVANVGRVDVSSALREHTARWRSRAVAGSPPVTQEFATIAEGWAAAMVNAPVAWGSWHGDWRATNMAVTSRGCSVWDWERFTTGVPVGYDALHLYLTSKASSARDLQALPVKLYENAARLLAPFGIRTLGHAELVATGYLLELAGRYLDDDQVHAGARLGAVGDWILPHLRCATSWPIAPPGHEGASGS